MVEQRVAGAAAKGVVAALEVVHVPHYSIVSVITESDMFRMLIAHRERLEAPKVA
jgi:hypothetical protein